MTTLQIILLVIAAISAVIDIAAVLSANARREYLFKPLTMLLIIAVALADDDPVSTEYQVLIVLGLLVSLVGDVFLMLPSDRFVPGLVSFLIAHLLYISAFTLESTGRAPIYYAIPFALYGVGILAFLWRHIDHPLRGPVMVYLTVILLMGWQAVNRHVEIGGDGTLLAAIGAYCFIASDSALALERFRGRWPSAPVWVMGLYFAAQALIALSI